MEQGTGFEGSANRTDGSACRTNGFGDRTNRPGDRMNRRGDRMNRRGDRMNRPGDKMDGSEDRLNESPDFQVRVFQIHLRYPSYASSYRESALRRGDEVRVLDCAVRAADPLCAGAQPAEHAD